MTCPECGGEGVIVVLGQPTLWEDAYCNSTEERCPVCSGTGAVEEEATPVSQGDADLNDPRR